MTPCQKQLEKRPNGKTVKAAEILSAGLMAAQKCYSCKTNCSTDMVEFAEKWSKEIDAAVAKVCDFAAHVESAVKTN